MNIRLVHLPVLAALLITGCTAPRLDQIDLMPSPDVYGDGMLNPLPEDNPFVEKIAYQGLLYATDRAPSAPDDAEKYYRNERGQILRLGVAGISLHDSTKDWADVREISMVKNRSRKYPLRVTGVKEYGILEKTIPGFAEREDYDENLLDGDEEFADAVNEQLARSTRKDVYIYVHGYKVVFENPMLVATELWHFLGYDGVMIGYAWPSTPSRFAYLRDTDTSNGFARHFRKFLEYLAENTAAETINVIGYSNGTQMVARAFEQLALINQHLSREQVEAKLRLGQLFLVGSDLDRDVFATYVADGVLDVANHVSVYVSDKDKALGFAQWLTRRNRLGQMLDDENLEPALRRLFSDRTEQLSLIDVSDGEGVDSGNGHGYFRNSPWVSSDILMNLRYGLSAPQRGLIRSPDLPVWQFPPDYISRLWESIAEVDPDFARAYRARQTEGIEP